MVAKLLYTKPKPIKSPDKKSDSLYDTQGNSNSNGMRVSSMHVSSVLHNHAADLMLFDRNKRLRVAVYANFYPVAYQLTSKEGKVVKKSAVKGFDVDLIKGFCKSAKLKVVFVVVDSFYSIWRTPGEWDEHFDVAIGGIGRSRWRVLGGVEWTVPYFKVRRSIVYNLKDPIIRFPEDVTGKIAGTMGTTGMDDGYARLDKVGKGDMLQARHATDEKDLKDLLAGRLQGLMRGSFVGFVGRLLLQP